MCMLHNSRVIIRSVLTERILDFCLLSKKIDFYQVIILKKFANIHVTNGQPYITVNR